jgi:capsular exopolysaccharide synthesis family protein
MTAIKESWEEQEESFNLRAFLFKYLRHWYLFVFFAVLALGLAYAYLLYARPIFEVSSVLLVKDEKKGFGGGNDMLKELEMFSGNKLVENEIEILKSRYLHERVVDELNLKASYFEEGSFRDTEIFGQSPIWVGSDQITEQGYEEPAYVRVLNKNQYELLDEGQNVLGQFAFSQPVKSAYGRFRVFLNDSLYREPSTVKVRFRNREKLIESLTKDIDIALLNQKSTVIKLSLEDASPARGKAILKKLLEVYTLTSLEDKNREASNTLRFIDSRLKLITGELVDVEKNVESYKSAEGFTDISSEANLFLEKVKDNDIKLNEVGIKIKVLDDIDSYVQNSQGVTGTGVPASAGMVSDPVMVQLLGKLSELEIQREKYARTTQAGNPLLETVNTQIANTKQAIRESINSQKRGLQVTQASLQGLNRQFEYSIRAIPRKEREFVNIKRQQSVKEGLYLYLLQKQEETALSYASTVSDSRVVDTPFVGTEPVKPKRSLVFLGALLVGLLIPVGIVNVRDLLNNKVQNRKEIEDLARVPILTDIAQRNKKDTAHLIELSSRSAIAEQFRALRTNLQYIFSNQDGHRVILFTSSVGGEGKSFVSLNLASSLAYSGKKVVIIGMDLRKPKLSQYLETASEPGVTNYLIGLADPTDIVQTTPVPNLYFIPSGPNPPNPTELLESGRTEELIRKLKQEFDYVLIDSPPIGLVTDALIIGNFADAVLFIIRQDYTLKAHLEQLGELYRSRKFKSMHAIFNGVDFKKGGYGYGYGYGYYEDKPNARSKKKLASA